VSARRYFVVIGDAEIHEFTERTEAMAFWRAHLDKGMAVDARSASVHVADDRATLERWRAGWKPVDFVASGVPRDYYTSEAGRRAGEDRRAKQLQQGPPWRFEVGDEQILTVEEIWPDGDAPENPTLADVLEVVRKHGRWAIARDWGFEDHVEVEGIDPFRVEPQKRAA
jgi:hypothetical protein